MIALNERDADRMAAYLRSELKKIDEVIGNLERLTKSFLEFADSVGGNSVEIERKTAGTRSDTLVRLNAQKEEIEELLVLLMAGSGK